MRKIHDQAFDIQDRPARTKTQDQSSFSRSVKVSAIALSFLMVTGISGNTAFAADTQDVPQLALSDKGDDWFRMLANRYDVCGNIGNTKTRRAEQLAKKYDTFANAVASGDETAMRTAATKLSKYIKTNTRTKECWSILQRRADIPRSVRRELKAMSS